MYMLLGTQTLQAGVHEVFDTIYIKGAHMRERDLKIMALGPEKSAILDGLWQSCAHTIWPLFFVSSAAVCPTT